MMGRDVSLRCGAARRTGFTLIEIILAIAITGFIMTVVYATLFATIRARDRIEKEGLTAKIGPAILDMIERDVAGAFCWNIHRNDIFFGEDRNISGEPADEFHMVTTTDSTIVELSGDEPVRSDLCEVSYRLRHNASAPELMELFRRQDFHLDEKISEGGNYELIYSRIKSFEVSYFKDLYEGADRLDEWDAKKRNSLPAAMEIVLRLEIDPRLAGYGLDGMERPTQLFRRVIFFPRGSELTMWMLPSWHAVNLKAMAGPLAAYIIIPEIILGLSFYRAWRAVEGKHFGVTALYGFLVMLLYLGSACFFYFLVEKIILG